MKVLCIPDNATAIAALHAGKIDLLPGGRGSISTQEAVSLGKTNPGIKIGWYPNPGNSIELRVDHIPFKDIRVRKALQLAINRKAIAASHYLGTVDGKPAGLFSPEYTGWTIPYDKWPQYLKDMYSYNPKKAKQLLAEAGYPNGFKTNCEASGSDDSVLLQIIKAQFKDIGVDMTINLYSDMSAYMNFVMAGKHDQMSFTNAIGMLMRPDISILRRTTKGDRQNFTHNNDAKYDAIVDKFNAAATLDAAKKIAIEADTYALEQNWSVNICPYGVPVAWQSYLKGYSGENIMAGPFNYSRWWIDKSMKK